MNTQLINGAYQIVDFDKTKAECANFIETEGLPSIVIQSDDDKKVAKKARTAIRKKQDEIKTLRLQLNEALMGTFNLQAKELEKMLTDADNALKAKINDYEDSIKPIEPEAPKSYSILVSSFSEENIEKVRKYALELGCGVN